VIALIVFGGVQPNFRVDLPMGARETIDARYEAARTTPLATSCCIGMDALGLARAVG
jgi:hypothetical protein